jgi:hypothetical protein
MLRNPITAVSLIFIVLSQDSGSSCPRRLRSRPMRQRTRRPGTAVVRPSAARRRIFKVPRRRTRERSPSRTAPSHPTSCDRNSSSGFRYNRPHGYWAPRLRANLSPLVWSEPIRRISPPRHRKILGRWTRWVTRTVPLHGPRLHRSGKCTRPGTRAGARRCPRRTEKRR